MLIDLQQITIPPGDSILLNKVTWSQYEQILAELGEYRPTKVSYSKGLLEIMTPLFSHENAKVVIGDFVKILLEELNLDYEPAGSTTFKNEKMQQGVEPDESFYIANCQRIRGKERIDLTIDPPPDLAIEIDITNRTKFSNYLLLGVPELWRYDGKKLQINVLVEGQYVESALSNLFPNFDIKDKIPELLQRSKEIGSAKIRKVFREWVKEQS